MNIDIAVFLASMMVAATPVIFAAIGELVVEKSGVLNLGVEGMMITGAICGFILANATGSVFLGVVAAAIGGALLSLIFATLTQFLLSNQVATGLALTLFGIGLAALLGKPYEGVRVDVIQPISIPVLSDIPVLGKILFSHDPLLYFGLFIVFAVWWFLTKTRGGLILRAVGESHDAAHALGYNVVRVRILAIMFGGACAGLGGAYLSLLRVPQWTENVTAGVGWIALAIVVFASWKPGRLLIGAYLFGGIGFLQLHLQVENVPIPVEVLNASPYIATIIALVILSAGKSGRSNAAPAALGQPFHASR